MNVSATTTINTFFARILPSLQTLTVSDTAQSTRANVMMTLVLDHSGSMNKNGGAQALPPAVIDFLSYFSDYSRSGCGDQLRRMRDIELGDGTPFHKLPSPMWSTAGGQFWRRHLCARRAGLRGATSSAGGRCRVSILMAADARSWQTLPRWSCSLPTVGPIPTTMS